MRGLILLLIALQAVLLERHFGFGGHVSPAALVLMEGFDFWAIGQKAARGWANGSNQLSTIATPGRFGGSYGNFSRGSGTGTNTTFKALPSTYTTLIIGFAMQTTANGFFAVTTSTGSVIATVRINASSFAEVWNASALVATSSVSVADGGWHYYELKLVIAGASGSCELHTDGAADIATTTGNFGTTAIGGIGVSLGGSTTIHLDDIYVVDTTGTRNNTFLGDVRVVAISPNGAGAHTAWTPNGAATNYGCVADATPDDDTTYISDATVGDIDTYTFSDVDASATVFGIQRNLYARKDDANTRQIAPVVRQAATDYVGATFTLSSTYAYYSELKDSDPTGAAWTAANVNGDEWGVKVIA